MKSKFFLAAFALMMGVATFANAQNHGRYNRHNGGGGYNGNNGYYNGNGGNCNNNNGYYNNGNGGNCNNGGYNNNNGYRRDRCGNGYGNRRVYRRPANYCQQVPVVVYQQPVYCPPPPRVYVGRPRVNINIGF